MSEPTAEEAAAQWVAANPAHLDPLNGDNGYPSTIEETRIEKWPCSHPDDLIDLMAYVHERWSYPDYWVENDIEEHSGKQRQYTISTGGWSGNESLIGALERNQFFMIIAPWSWRRGGHYVYRIPIWERGTVGDTKEVP